MIGDVKKIWLYVLSEFSKKIVKACWQIGARIKPSKETVHVKLVTDTA